MEKRTKKNSPKGLFQFFDRLFHFIGDASCKSFLAKLANCCANAKDKSCASHTQPLQWRCFLQAKARECEMNAQNQQDRDCNNRQEHHLQALNCLVDDNDTDDGCKKADSGINKTKAIAETIGRQRCVFDPVAVEVGVQRVVD